MTSQSNLQSDFLTGFSQNKSAPWKNVAAGLQHLQRGRDTQPEAQSYSALTTAFQIIFLALYFSLKTITELPRRAARSGAQLFRQRDALTSPLVQAWPPPSYPHSRGCGRHTNRDFKTVEKNPPITLLLFAGHS